MKPVTRFVLSMSLTIVLFTTNHCSAINSAQLPADKTFKNSVGIDFVRVEPDTFDMGFEGENLDDSLLVKIGQLPTGDFDEHPKHSVTITKTFYIGAFEVTNAQYEQFDPAHKKYRQTNPLSKDDDDAVIFVSWHEAKAFCDWLSKKENLPYRLPTEAEWEYTCRTGTKTPFYTGRLLPENFKENNKSLKVGQNPPSPLGLFDMHGNLEEWCLDWYGPYTSSLQTDPVGYADGDFKVTRSGSHSTYPYYLRSANRLGSHPDDKQWMIGFRVVIAQLPETTPVPLKKPEIPTSAKLKRSPASKPDPDKPYFQGPLKVVKIPENSMGPLFDEHNHFMAVTDCPNGDLIAAWFTCQEEMGRELAISSSRLPAGTNQWRPAKPFWDCPDRNDHTQAFFKDANGKIFHFNGLGLKYRQLAVIMRTSNDSGYTWSKAKIIQPDHTKTGKVIESVFTTQGGKMLVPYDGRGGSIIRLNPDKGSSWYDPGGNIRGTHAGVAQLDDDSFIAFGRHGAIDGKMPISRSNDAGKSWTYSPSPFQPIHSGRRVALIKLNQGPLFLASFCHDMLITDITNTKRPVSGLFAALSYDGGYTWPNVRLVSDDSPAKTIETMDGDPITMSDSNAEPVGYLSVCQDPHGTIHLLTSRNHYRFNLKWLTTPPPKAAQKPPAKKSVTLSSKTLLANTYKPLKNQLPTDHDFKWGLNARGFKFNNAVTTENNLMKIDLKTGQQFWLRSEKKPGFANVDPAKGFTAEFHAKISKTAQDDRGLDFELYDGAGSRYAITIKENDVFWYHKGTVLGSAFLPFPEYKPIVHNIDNTDKFHTFRLAVTPNRNCQLYRDGKLLANFPHEYRTPRYGYIYIGAGQNTTAQLKYVSYDLTGPYQP